MAMLTVGDGFATEIPGLGRHQNFMNLSQKRVTKAIRSALRAQYGEARVEVSCEAVFADGEWVGACKIAGRPHRYHVRE